MRLVASALAALTLVFPLLQPAQAAAFPERGVRIVVPFPAGGSNDVVARLLGTKLQQMWGQPVVIDNRAGAGGNIGAEGVARSAADGYTLLLISSSFTMNNTILKLPFDPDRAFEPVALLGAGPSVLAVPVSLPVKTVGVMGDGRTYDFVVGLRAVTSVDGMTADFYPFDMKFLGAVATRIINEVKGVNRVVYDVTSKPPGTIEWE